LALALPLAILPTLPAQATSATPTVTIDGLADQIKYNAAPDEFTVTVKNPGTTTLDGRLFLGFSWAEDVTEVDGGKVELYDDASKTWKPLTAARRNVGANAYQGVGVWLGDKVALAPGATRQFKLRFGFHAAPNDTVTITRSGLYAQLFAAGRENSSDPALAQANAPFMPDVIHLSIKGFPESLVAGGQSATFEAHLTSDLPVTVPWPDFTSVFDSVQTGSGWEQPTDPCVAAIQVRDPMTGAWVAITEAGNFMIPVKKYAGGTPTDQVLTYRIALGAKYPVAHQHKVYFSYMTGGAGAMLPEAGLPVKAVQAPAGTKVNDCATFTDAPVTVPTTAPQPTGKPAGNAGPKLAETGGSDSNATLYGVAGGAVLVAGAAAVVFARRRKNA
jgi:LPXTG-motif cell wall-anchored protein